ncbi:hypothetical protein BN12_3210003 [Nostocoides japonicum T1-X7]|uniref:Uncharacterized protein n=1 Tax=Nostocoides japonicum T1-X7 TaxID=1194083 RepID=A0A077LYJ8_9MICO|nr:hypothetical protein BN12_3210003 [Tetrasphaera japonica T1-X7]
MSSRCPLDSNNSARAGLSWSSNAAARRRSAWTRSVAAQTSLWGRWQDPWLWPSSPQAINAPAVPRQARTCRISWRLPGPGLRTCREDVVPVSPRQRQLGTCGLVVVVGRGGGATVRLDQVGGGSDILVGKMARPLALAIFPTSHQRTGRAPGSPHLPHRVAARAGLSWPPDSFDHEKPTPAKGVGRPEPWSRMGGIVRR